MESEVIFHLIIKAKSSNFTIEDLSKFLEIFQFLTIEENVRSLFKSYVKSYNLKPNDALILATTKYYQIPYLISLDKDFSEACEKEEISLINSLKKLKEILKNT